VSTGETAAFEAHSLALRLQSSAFIAGKFSQKSRINLAFDQKFRSIDQDYLTFSEGRKESEQNWRSIGALSGRCSWRAPA
jgi:hypothetical protein